MKIIDLLSEIVNGRKMPVSIKVNDDKYEIKDEFDMIAFLSDENFYLQDEVEIIEEDKKIEKLNDYYGKSWLAIEEDMFDKINEIIDYLDYLKSKGE